MDKNHGTVRPATLGQIKDLISALVQALPRLTFEQAKYWIGRKKELAERLRFLYRTPVAKAMDTIQTETFPVWKTITIGVHQSAAVYREALFEAGFRITCWARDLLNKIQIFQTVRLNLGKIQLKDLGFTKAVSLDEICVRAKNLFGLERCPADTGPQTRLDYSEQPSGERLYVAMEPVVDAFRKLWIFKMYCDDDGRWLDGCPADFDVFFDPSSYFLFVFSRKSFF